MTRILVKYFMPLLFITAVSGQALAQDYDEITLRHATGVNESYSQAAATTYFNERLLEESNGKVRVQMFWGGTLGGLGEALDLVSRGAVDISGIVPGYFVTQLPLYSMTNALPHTFFEPRHAMDALINAADLPEAQSEYETNNIKPLIYRHIANYHFLCTRPVRTMADFQGLRVRSFGSYFPTMLQSIGAVPVNVIVSDAYEALNRGSLDCTISSPSDLTAYKLYEAARYIVDVPMGAIVAYSDSINLAKFNSLTPDTQELLVRVGLEATDWWAKQTVENEAAAFQEMLDLGVELVEFEEVDELRSAIPNMPEIWIAAMEERGLGEQANAYADAIMNYYNTNVADQ